MGIISKNRILIDSLLGNKLYNKYECVHFVSKGSQVEVSKLLCISVLGGCFNLANSADADKMQHYAAFHLGLPCL